MEKVRRLYYLTGVMTGIACIAMQRLKVSRFVDLNDPFELMGVNVNDSITRKAFRATRDELNKTKGLICFTQDWKSPLMWGHYADKHAGMALGFDIPSELLTDVNYATRLFNLQLDPKTKRPVQGTVDMLIATKFADWSYEKECRMFVSLDPKEAEGGMYFVPFSNDLKFREIVLGPRSNYKIAEIRALAKKVSGEDEVKVTQSRIAFSRFEVLENKVATAADKELDI
ncbi:DUF2971 domain-containing protein [Variovorax sp. VaC1]|uniref:DUF2971 domain-containing protein n=1 Tax=Variovorax sp. VaC1 TaxID=3373132 RepID=UPI003747CE32